MSILQRNSRVVILVKALPQPSKTYGETVCCAGVTGTRDWKRLFPIRYRHLVGDSSFKRWDWVDFDFGRPKNDSRMESCHVHEESISIRGSLPKDERTTLLEPMLVASTDVAAAAGKSLALVRPRGFTGSKNRQMKLQEIKRVFDWPLDKPICLTKNLQKSNQHLLISDSSSKTMVASMIAKTAIGKHMQCSGARRIELMLRMP